MAEARASLTVTIDRPVDEVFAYMADYGNNQHWQTGLVSARHDQPMGVGAHITTTRTVMGRESTSQVRVTAYEPGRCFRSRSVSGPVDYEGGYDFEPSGDGATRVTYRGVITTRRFLGPVGKLLAKQFQKQMESDLQRLKALLES